jgi:hypothetical protein
MDLCGTRRCAEPITCSTAASSAGGSCELRFARISASVGVLIRPAQSVSNGRARRAARSSRRGAVCGPRQALSVMAALMRPGFTSGSRCAWVPTFSVRVPSKPARNAVHGYRVHAEDEQPTNDPRPDRHALILHPAGAGGAKMSDSAFAPRARFALMPADPSKARLGLAPFTRPARICTCVRSIAHEQQRGDRRRGIARPRRANWRAPALQPFIRCDLQMVESAR